jgi:hypothetical protein
MTINVKLFAAAAGAAVAVEFVADSMKLPRSRSLTVADHAETLPHVADAIAATVGPESVVHDLHRMIARVRDRYAAGDPVRTELDQLQDAVTAAEREALKVGVHQAASASRHHVRQLAARCSPAANRAPTTNPLPARLREAIGELPAFRTQMTLAAADEGTTLDDLLHAVGGATDIIGALATVCRRESALLDLAYGNVRSASDAAAVSETVKRAGDNLDVASRLLTRTFDTTRERLVGTARS